MATFPILRTPELLVSLQDIGHTSSNAILSADDIDRPTRERIIPAYLWFFTHTTSLGLDEVKMAARLWIDNMPATVSGDDGADVNAYNEMLGESVHYGILWQALNQLMRWAMVDDFALRDLRDPQASRVRKLLSALVNFHLFELEQTPQIEALEEAFERDEHARARSLAETQEWADRIAGKKAELDRERDLVAQLGRENTERRNKLVRAKEMEEPALARLESVKRERNTLQEKIDNGIMILKQNDAEINRLRSRIIQSPDRVRQTLNDMAHSLQTLKDELVEIDRKGRDHEARIQVAKKYEQDICSVIKLLDEWSAELTRSSSTTSRLSSLLEGREASHEQLRELDLRLQQLLRRSSTTDEALGRQTELAGQKKEAVRLRMGRLQEAYEAVMHERGGMLVEQEGKTKQARALEEAISDLVKGHEAEMMKAEAAYAELRNDVLTYSAKLNKALDSLNATIQRPYEA